MTEVSLAKTQKPGGIAGMDHLGSGDSIRDPLVAGGDATGPGEVQPRIVPFRDRLLGAFCA